MTDYAASERIPKEEDTEDARMVAGMVTAIAAHQQSGNPKSCMHIRRVLVDEDGVTVQTLCHPRAELRVVSTDMGGVCLV